MMKQCTVQSLVNNLQIESLTNTNTIVLQEQEVVSRSCISLPQVTEVMSHCEKIAAEVFGSVDV